MFKRVTVALTLGVFVIGNSALFPVWAGMRKAKEAPVKAGLFLLGPSAFPAAPRIRRSPAAAPPRRALSTPKSADAEPVLDLADAAESSGKEFDHGRGGSAFRKAVLAAKLSAGLLLSGLSVAAQPQPAVEPAIESPFKSMRPTGKLDLPLIEPFDSARVREKKKPVVNDRIFWVLPNYHTEEEPGTYKPLTTGQKFTLAFNDSFDPPYAQLDQAFFAGVAHWEHQYPSWGMGWSGYGKRYAEAFGTQVGSNFLAEAVFPTLFREDPRYFRKGKGGFWRRAGYAASRAFVTRTDSGGSRFNFSGILGNATMTVVSNTYVPPQDRTLRDNAHNFGFQLGMNVVGNLLNEFWPDIKRGVFRK